MMVALSLSEIWRMFRCFLSALQYSEEVLIILHASSLLLPFREIKFNFFTSATLSSSFDSSTNTLDCTTCVLEVTALWLTGTCFECTQMH